MTIAGSAKAALQPAVGLIVAVLMGLLCRVRGRGPYHEHNGRFVFFKLDAVGSACGSYGR